MVNNMNNMDNEKVVTMIRETMQIMADSHSCARYENGAIILHSGNYHGHISFADGVITHNIDNLHFDQFTHADLSEFVAAAGQSLAMLRSQLAIANAILTA